MRPPLMTKDKMIGICTASHVADRKEYAEIITAIESKTGFKVLEANNLYKDTYGYLASPEERASDFNQLIADERVGMIFFGGGEGSNELLPFIDFENIKRNPKIICSYSDGTTILNTVWAKTGLETFYGQAPHIFNELTEYDYGCFQRSFVEGSSNKHVSNSKWYIQTSGTGKGILIGGYARNFAMLLGNRYFPLAPDEKYILFIEDHEVFGNVGYVSAMLSHMEQYDFIDNVRGLLFGNYADNIHPELLARIKRFGEKHKIPSAYCDDFGHGENHAVLPIGRMAEFNSEKELLNFL
ncbi:S66 peptidase family protein [Murimonas intestini]|uniref:S66 peptidase family protein n=1 Tax=Murimonas intestini TaxID=1337051 RepID=UPI0011DD210D|nr:LD-carboxypeptidase [Murimonas intestini]